MPETSDTGPDTTDEDITTNVPDDTSPTTPSTSEKSRVRATSEHTTSEHTTSEHTTSEHTTSEHTTSEHTTSEHTTSDSPVDRATLRFRLPTTAMFDDTPLAVANHRDEWQRVESAVRTGPDGRRRREQSRSATGAGPIGR